MMRIRLVGYAFVIGLMFAGLVLIEISSAEGLRLLVQSEMARTLGTSEWSPVEWLQLTALVTIILLALQSSRWQKRRQAFGRTLAAIAAAALIRELDLFLDYFLVDHLWQVLIAVLFAFSAVMVSRNRRHIVSTLHDAMATPAMTLIYCGFIVLVFANLLGHAPFWESVLGDAYQRSAKIAAEEMTELLGYCFWLAGQIEYTLDCRSRHLLAANRVSASS